MKRPLPNDVDSEVIDLKYRKSTPQFVCIKSLLKKVAGDITENEVTQNGTMISNEMEQEPIVVSML